MLREIRLGWHQIVYSLRICDNLMSVYKMQHGYSIQCSIFFKSVLKANKEANLPTLLIA